MPCAKIVAAFSVRPSKTEVMRIFLEGDGSPPSCHGWSRSQWKLTYWLEWNLIRTDGDALHPVEMGGKSRARGAPVGECKDALGDLFLAAQKEVIFTGSTFNRLAVFIDSDTNLLLCGGRSQLFNDDKTANLALLFLDLHTPGTRSPQCESWGDCRNSLPNEEESLDDKRPRIGTEGRGQMCDIQENQGRRVRADHGWPPAGVADPSQPFWRHNTTVDLFGPHEVRDEVKKKM